MEMQKDGTVFIFKQDFQAAELTFNIGQLFKLLCSFKQALDASRQEEKPCFAVEDDIPNTFEV